MLKTNTKKARENIKKYIIDNYTPDSYGLPETSDFNTIAANILETFHAEKPYSAEYIRKHHTPELETFKTWCTGLPSILDTCYYYNRSAVDDLGAILEETESEKSKYSEQDAENLLTYLIYRELTKEATRS